MERTKFINYMGDTPVMRLFDFLITGRDFDYSLSDIARNSGVGWATLYRIWPGFIENKLVVNTRNIGNAKLFKLNSESDVVQNLIKLYKSILRSGVGLRDERVSVVGN
ncbi:hypothetical protein CMI38_02425 [Candidatus Pacearchaeota archaeon]|jgi:hypothetical protein|nr:hypothetical protein [Candidatus Pacearchaeota archaeon]|tara:strand:- start:356 stop:679 length:324 start_codon:yes stop_codon:yes gene_type:complete